ncbi:amino acid adenylation domain-containing protein [Brevibacillus brevis]|uniref:non-ribosomal peptide synthetase n=1 Tax=Brevibacillus brevis TaxID=1393 RepID=UPI003D2217E7
MEAALVKVTGIQEAVVAAREVEPGIKDLCAYYTKQGDLTAGDIRQALTERMPGYMVPGYFVELAEMPLTPNGKLDRKRLPDPRGHLQRETKYEAPRNETEAKLVTIWQKALVLERIGIDDRYFDIGGDSIKSIRVITSINREWKIELQLIEFYQHPTIRELAAFLQAKERRVEDGRRAAVIQEMESWKSQLVEQANDPSWLTHGVEDYYPLSDIQQGMIYHSLSRPDLYAYHDQFVYQFEDKTFNEDAFLTALTALVDKHPILRTEFNLQDFTAPVQIVRERGTLDYELISLVGMNKEQQEAAIFRAMEEDRKRPFFQNGVAASPWRMRLFCLDQCNYSIGWFYHHALLDGWSNALVITELSALYFAGKQGEIQVEPLAYSYKELLIEQAMLKQGEDIATYWRRELDDCKRLEVLTAQNSAILDQAFIKTTLTFGSDTGVMLRQFAAEHKTTIKAVCFSAYTAMMNSMAREGDFLVGLVVNNRPLCADGEQILGCFLNTVPVRVRVEKEITWLDLLDDMNRKLTEIQQYGRVSLQHIQQVIGKTTFESSSLFDNFFNYVDFHVLRRIDAKQLAHGVIDINNFERTNSDLDFTCVFAEEQLSIVLTTAERAYPKAVAERLLAIYERALHAIIETPERPMKKSDLLLPDQLDYLCQRAARMARVVPPGTIHERFESQAAYRPTEPALAARDQELTYGELNRRANQLARRLQESGVGPGNIVGLMCGRTVELIIGLLAILKTGGAYLPIDPTYPQERIRHMIEDSGTQLLLSTETLLGVGTYTGKWINLENSSLYEGESPNLGATIGEKDLAYCIYTSGSTGRPKGVLLEHRNVVNLLLGMVERIDFRPGNTFVSVTTVSFDIFVLETLLPLMNGMRVVLATEKEQADPAALGRLLAASQADIFQTTPSRIQLLLGDEIGRAGLAGLSEILIGGEPFHMDLIKSLRTCTKARLHNMYGPTETTVWSMTVDLTHAEEVTLGEPIANTEILLLDSNGEIQMFDAIGELCIAGDGLARGYHNREDLTQEKFIQHPLDPERRLYKTGDLALWRTNGEILYLGRLDQQVKIRGHRVELGEIEHALASVEGLQKPIAAAVPSESGEKLLVAYYLAPEELPVFELRGHLALLLPDYMLPNAFVRLDSYPLLPNGKIDRKALPAPLLTREALGVPYQEAESKTEKELVRLWQSVLGVETIGVHDNFFELGGSSISLVQFHVKLEQLYPGRVTIAELFSHSTVRNLAVRLEQSDTQSVINIKTITLPKRFQARGARSEGAALQFALPAPLTEGLRELALQEKVDLEDILLTAGLYLFGEIVHDQPITLYAMEERDVLRPVSVERSQVRDFSEFFQQVRMARHDSSIDIAMDAVRLLAFRNQAGQVAPLFYRQDSVRSGERLGEWFGFALGHADSSGTIKFVCDYDGGLLQRNALEEWIRGFVRLLQAILIKMKPEV